MYYDLMSYIDTQINPYFLETQTLKRRHKCCKENQ